MVCDPADPDRADEYARVRRHRQDEHGRRPAGTFLPGGQYLLVLFLGLFEAGLEYFPDQSAYVREGVFPPVGGSHLRGDFQSAPLRDPGRVVRGPVSLVLLPGSGRHGDLGAGAGAAAGCDDCGTGTGLRHLGVVADDQVSRSRDSLYLHRAALDVCHADRLPAQHGGTGAVAHAHPGQSDDRDRRDLPLRHAGTGLLQLGGARLQLRLYGGAVAPQRRHLQPGAAHLHGHHLNFPL